jgi:hypothetical protein
MIKAKDCLYSLAPRIVTCLGLGLSVLEAGCSSVSGLRSIATERPSFLAIWDRPAGSPTPEDDSYVLSMRAGQARAADLAKRKDELASGQRDDQSADRYALPGGPESAQKRQPSDPKSPASPDDNTIRVSLGRPEPLPGVALALAPPGRPVSAGTGPQWKADKNESPAGNVANVSPVGDPGIATDGLDKNESPAGNVAVVSRPAPEEDIEETEPARQAQRDVPAANGDWKAILTRAEAKLDTLQSYQMRVSRQERVNGQLQPEEEILLSIRRDPKAVRLEWASGPSKGREVIYSITLDPRMLFVHMPPAAIPLPAMKIPVDSPLVMRNSRHAITDAGLDKIVEKLRKSERGGDQSNPNPGVLKYQGTDKPEGLARACHHFVRLAANGETWNVYLDERSLLPCMVVGQDSHGALIERYVYREIRENPTELAAAGAFEPAERWGETKGLLSRFARAATGSNMPTSAGSTTR